MVTGRRPYRNGNAETVVSVERLRREVAAQRGWAAAEQLVRTSVIPRVGHTSLYTRSDMQSFLDEIVLQLRDRRAVP